jgi:polysaccharide export outer membrane protein
LDFTMSHAYERFRRSSPRESLLLTVLCLTSLAGCSSGGSSTSVAGYAQPQPATDSIRAEALNRRIAAAATRDSIVRAGVAGTEADYRIGSNDLINVAVFGADAFSGDFRVGEAGDISMPLLGAVDAAGRTTSELESHLEAKLADSYMRDPHVTVQVSEMQSHGISVVGSVRQPGVYQVSGSVTLLEVLAMAQGLTPEAGSRVYVVRPSSPGAPAFDAAATDDLDATATAAYGQPELIEIDLGALLESGRTEENLALRAGDIVQVRPAGVVYVVGEVNRPGGFPTPAGSPMTVLQALAMAEGLGSTAAADRAVIVREGPNAERIEIPVNLKSVLDGSDPPPTLAARDVLFVPNNGMKSFGLGVVNALVSMVTLRGLVY